MLFSKVSVAAIISICLAQVYARPGGSQWNSDQGSNSQLNGQGSGIDSGGGTGLDAGDPGQGGRPGNSFGQDEGDGDQNDNEGSGQFGNGRHRYQGQEDGQAQGLADATTVTVTVTESVPVAAAANTAAILTVMTVTVSAPCDSGSAVTSTAAMTGLGSSTSVIAAPPGGAAASSSVLPPSPPSGGNVTAPRKFVTKAVDIFFGLTSLPVAAASALGQAPDATAFMSSASSTATSSDAIVTPTVSAGNFLTASETVASFVASGSIPFGVVTSIPLSATASL